MREAGISLDVALSLEVTIEATIEFCRLNSAAFACWKSPLGNMIHLVVDFEGSNEIEDLSLETSNPGFLIAPFHKEAKPLFLKNDLLITWNENKPGDLKVSGNNEEYFAFLNSYQRQEDNKPIFNQRAFPESDNYIQLVENAVKGINSGQFNKVVPSRAKKIEYDGTLKLAQYFTALGENYENAFVSMHYTQHTGLWMGATPEILLETEGEMFRTVSLAGTQPFNPNQSLGEVAWTQKEIEEQALVSRYIIDCFKRIRLREFVERGPRTVKAGNLIHLKTTYEVNMKDTNFAELGTTMLQLLHPTSAICGMPLQPSLEFLEMNEKYDRELYSGFLGPLNMNDKTTLYVNLRCMKVEQGYITLYAGAGVTEDSVPLKEWEETEMKMNTLFNIISSD